MTTKAVCRLLGVLASVITVLGQEPPTPTTSSSPEQSPSPSATPLTTRTVRISFVPPPLDGTISLGIYDDGGRLVRVLHQQAPVDAFTIGADALVTKWDGKDDDGSDLPAGKYRAHGFAVGALQIENVAADSAASPPPIGNDTVSIKLIANPLVRNDRPTVQLAVDFDDTDCYLKTVDGLPLYVINEQSGITSLTAAKSGEKSMDVWAETGAGIQHFRISKLDQMMAFDCGELELK